MAFISLHAAGRDKPGEEILINTANIVEIREVEGRARLITIAGGTILVHENLVTVREKLAAAAAR
jgi:hypothetical protein